MPKLKLKRTPAEERERELRKARKAAKRAAKLGSAAHARTCGRSGRGEFSGADTSSYVFDLPSKLQDTYDDADSDSEYGPQPARASASEPGPSTTGEDYARILAELEERRFREKLADAMDTDAFETGYAERLDSVESRLNDYAHVPERWRAGGMRFAERADDGEERAGGVDPASMEEEEYAEWVRRGMWRRTHAAEFEAAEREKQAHADRLKKEKVLKEETKKLAREAEEARRRRRVESTVRNARVARDDYENRWKSLLSAHANDASASAACSTELLAFSDVPWPIFPPRKDGLIRGEDINPDAVSLFLFPGPSLVDDEEAKERRAAARKERLRETILRFHPDKFEARVLSRVQEGDQEAVREAVGRVVRAVGELMKVQP